MHTIILTGNLVIECHTKTIIWMHMMKCDGRTENLHSVERRCSDCITE